MEGDDGIFSGKEQIRAWYENLVSLHGQGSLSDVQVEGDQVTALLTYTDDGLQAIGLDAIDNDWVVAMAGSKIQGYTATITAESMVELMAAMAAIQTAAKTESERTVLTVTCDGSDCAFAKSGPLTSGNSFTMILDVEAQDAFAEYGVAVLTLREGKGLEDLVAWPSTNPPLWAHVMGLVDEVPAGSTAQTTATIYDGPVYLVCFTAYPVTKSDVAGPLEVVVAE